MSEMMTSGALASRWAYVENLADKCERLDARLSVTDEGDSVLVVSLREEPEPQVSITCGPDGNGGLAYFWPWGARLLGAQLPGVAAVEIERFLIRLGGSGDDGLTGLGTLPRRRCR